MDFCLSLKLPEEMSRIALVRRVSRDVLTSFGVRSEDVDDLELLVGELATNAVCHAHDEAYMVEIRLSNNTAIVTVEDHGKGFNRDNVPQPGTVRSGVVEGTERIGGWGLPLVEMLADRVVFMENYPKGTTVRAEKTIAIGIITP